MTETPLPEKTEEPLNPRTFEIDENNICSNGDTIFDVKDVRGLLRHNQQPQPNAPVIFMIVAVFVGAQIGLPFADIETRDLAYDELNRRWRAIKDGTIGSYLNKLRKEKEHRKSKEAA